MIIKEKELITGLPPNLKLLFHEVSVKKIKSQATDWGKTFASHLNEGYVARKYKRTLKTQQFKKSNDKIDKNMNSYFAKERCMDNR